MEEKATQPPELALDAAMLELVGVSKLRALDWLASQLLIVYELIEDETDERMRRDGVEIRTLHKKTTIKVERKEPK